MGFKNFDLASIAPKLVKFPLFDKSFLNLAKFQNLNILSLFDFLDLDNFLNCLVYFILFSLISNLLILLLLLFFSKADLLLLFLSKASLLGDPVIFNIKMNGATILLKL